MKWEVRREPNALGGKSTKEFNGLYHLSTLQREGLTVWDAWDRQLHCDGPHLLFATADAVGISNVSGSAGHHARLGCWLMCDLPGRHKPDAGHYSRSKKPCLRRLFFRVMLTGPVIGRNVKIGGHVNSVLFASDFSGFA